MQDFVKQVLLDIVLLDSWYPLTQSSIEQAVSLFELISYGYHHRPQYLRAPSYSNIERQRLVN